MQIASPPGVTSAIATLGRSVKLATENSPEQLNKASGNHLTGDTVIELNELSLMFQNVQAVVGNGFRLLEHDGSTVAVYTGSGDKPRIVPCQESDDLCLLLRCAPTPKRKTGSRGFYFLPGSDLLNHGR